MIKVRVRHLHDADGTEIGEFLTSEIPDLISMFRNTNTVSYGSSEFDSSPYYGSQFVIDDNISYFEIIVGVE